MPAVDTEPHHSSQRPTPMRKQLVVAFALAVLSFTACGGGELEGGSLVTSGEAPSLATLTETYGCGYGFWIGNPQQTAALRFQYNGDEQPERVVVLPDGAWSVQWVEGEDLYANWCDDVIEVDEPTSVVVRTAPITGGTITWIDRPEDADVGTATIQVEGLEVSLGSGEVVELGDDIITNDMYGFYAG